MTWEWAILYVCVGLIIILLGDDTIRLQTRKTNPVGTRVLLVALWPLVVLLVLGVTVWVFCTGLEDDDG